MTDDLNLDADLYRVTVVCTTCNQTWKTWGICWDPPACSDCLGGEWILGKPLCSHCGSDRAATVERIDTELDPFAAP